MRHKCDKQINHKEGNSFGILLTACRDQRSH